MASTKNNSNDANESDDSLDREVESFGRTLSIRQDFNGELGGTVWDAALVFIKYFENTTEFPPGFWKGKRVLELGAGTGLVSIVLGLLGANVVCTDREPLLDLIQKNVVRNRADKHVTPHVLEWGDSATLEALKATTSNQPQAFDVIVACDVIAHCYSESNDKLLDTLQQASSENSLILIAFELRDQGDVAFMKKLGLHFQYMKVPDSRLDPHWQSEDIGIFRVTKKKSN